MTRLARVVVPGEPHHVTQRGNRRERVFFGDDDCRAYLDLISQAAQRAGTAIWSYCLMPNHVHFVMVPTTEDGLRATFAEAHRRYTARVHAREKWTGHLWQGRFSSTAMDGPHLMEAVRYVELNPVRAGLVAFAGDWPWSSARAQPGGPRRRGWGRGRADAGDGRRFRPVPGAAAKPWRHRGHPSLANHRPTGRRRGSGWTLWRPGNARAPIWPPQARSQTGNAFLRRPRRAIPYSVTVISWGSPPDVLVSPP